MSSKNRANGMPGLQIQENELALLAYFADVGTKVIRAQMVAGQIPENKMQMVKAMLNDVDGTLERLREYAEQKHETSG